MGRLFRMTWAPSKHRWRKMHKGQIHTVSCGALGCAPTKEESYRAANAWWERRFSELVAKPQIVRLNRTLVRAHRESFRLENGIPSGAELVPERMEREI